MIRKFFADTRDMILDGLAKVGLLRGGSIWWRERMRRRVEAAQADAENVRRSVRVQYRMCRECRTLVPNSERVCPACGAPMSGIPRGGTSRLLSLIAPSFGSVSTSLLAAMVVVYAAVGLGARDGSLFNPSGEVLAWLGMKWAPAVFAGQWWRLVNPIFLHGGLLHLAFNGYALANLGPMLESLIGSRRLLVLFIGTGVLSFAASCVVAPLTWSLGASGALYGLIGFGVVHARMVGGTLARRFSDDLMRWAVFGLLMSLAPGIDMAAHAGGLVAGALGGLFIGRRPGASPLVERLWTLAAIAAALLPVVGFVMAIRS